MAEPITREDYEEVKARLAELKPLLEKIGVEPHTTAAPPVRAAMPTDYGEIVRLRREFMTWSRSDLDRAIAVQLSEGSKQSLGIPVNRWADPLAMAAMTSDDVVGKALDTAGMAPLIRQDLEPMLYAAFVKRFPLFERLAREPSNGLVHGYNRMDALPEAEFIADGGSVNDKQSVYTRATTNIAVIALRVGVGLKGTFAVRAGGMGYNPEQQEIANGITAIAKKCQRTLFSGNCSVPGKIATDPEGAYDVNGFDGFRILIPSANTGYLAADELIINALNTQDGLLGVSGGRTSIVTMDGRDRVKAMNELQPNRRFVDRVDLVPGLPQVEAVNLGSSGVAPILAIPGDEVGHYTEVGHGTDVRDAYLLDESVISLPWLGSENPVILDIPVGVSGSLDHKYILFLMVGLKLVIPGFCAKLQIQVV